MSKWSIMTIVLLTPSLALAEQGVGSRSRATGFMLNVELGVSTPSVVSLGGLGGLGGLVRGWGAAPRLVLGGQLRRVGIGMIFGVSLNDTVMRGTDPEEPATWSMNFGPAVDVEVWSRSAAGLFLAFGLPITISLPDDNSTGAGFGLDIAIGGRYWFDRWLALGIKAGSLLNFLFWREDMDPTDAEWTSISWTIYGAIELRFVAGS